jgi:hypothetical protein
MLDLDSVLIMHQSSSQKEQWTHRLTVIATSIITAIILTIICYLLYSSVRKLQCYSVAATSSPNTSPLTPPITNGCTQWDTDEENSTTAEQRVTFSSYPIPDAAWRCTDATTLDIIYRRMADTATPPVLWPWLKTMCARKLPNKLISDRLIHSQTAIQWHHYALDIRWAVILLIFMSLYTYIRYVVLLHIDYSTFIVWTYMFIYNYLELLHSLTHCLHYVGFGPKHFKYFAQTSISERASVV